MKIKILFSAIIFLVLLHATYAQLVGDLLWYKHTGFQTGGTQWQGGFDFRVGVGGWNAFSNVFPTSSGVIYAVKSNGDLVWYKHTGQSDGSVRWEGGLNNKIGDGWNMFDKIFSNSNGIIYGVKPNGDLHWYKHSGWNAGTVQWEGGGKIGDGWNMFEKIFTADNGIIYGVKPNGDLHWYKHSGWNTGTVQWEGGGKIGDGWNTFIDLFATSNGIIYGIKQNGDLVWYKHLGYNNGSSSWEGGLQHKVGEGWQIYRKLFSPGNGIIYGIVGSRSNGGSTVAFMPINQRGTSFSMTRNSVPREYNRQNENRSAEASTGRYCTTAIVSEAKGDFEKIVLGNQNDKIFPGAIYFDNAIVEGTYNGPSDLQLQPYEIVTDLFSASSTGSSGIRVNPSLRDVRDGIGQLLRQAGNNTRNAANVFLEVNSLSTTEQLAFQLGAGYQGYGIDVEADFNYMKSLSKNVFMAKLVQVYYSVTTNSNVTGRTLIANPSIPSNLIYVSKVNYGRMGYVMISSDATREEIQAALNFRYSGSGNTVSVDARLRYEATMNSMSIKGFFLGGDADRLEIITSPNQLADFTRYVRNGLRVDPNVPPIPVSYEMKYLNDNATAGVRATTTYTERQCEPGKGIRIKLHNVGIEDHHGGDCSYAWGTAKVEVWETNAQRTPIKKIKAAPSLAGDLFWNRPNGRDPLRTTINYATVRGQGAIDQGTLNGIGLERVYMLDPKAVNEGRILIRISLNINTNHKDNDFAALGFHGMNRVETRDYWLRDVLVTQDDYTRKKDTNYKYGTLQVGKFCSNTDRVHCFYGFFSILNER